MANTLKKIMRKRKKENMLLKRRNRPKNRADRMEKNMVMITIKKGPDIREML